VHRSPPPSLSRESFFTHFGSIRRDLIELNIMIGFQDVIRASSVLGSRRHTAVAMILVGGGGGAATDATAHPRFRADRCCWLWDASAQMPLSGKDCPTKKTHRIATAHRSRGFLESSAVVETEHGLQACSVSHHSSVREEVSMEARLCPTAQVLLSTMGVALLTACSGDVTQENAPNLELAAAIPAISVYPKASAATEAGEPAFVRVALTRRPRGPVTIDIVPSDRTELTALPARITFRPHDWAVSKLVTLRSVDDSSFDGDRSVEVELRVSSSDRAFSTSAVGPIEVLSVDDDYTVTGYVAHDLVLGGAPLTGVAGLNHRAQVIGSYDAEGIARPVLWQNGIAAEIATLGASDSSSFAVDINDAGAVLGWSNTAEGVKRFISEGQHVEATDGEVVALNDRGHTAGEALYADGERTEVPSLGNGPSESRGLNESDHVTGFGRPLPSGWHPFLWGRGELTDLGTLGGPAGQGLDINEHDQIVGWMHDASIRDRPFLYAGGQVIDLGSVTGALSGVANSINNRGDIVGSDGVRGAADEGWVGRPGQLTALRSLLVDDHCFRILEPIEINDGGYIAGRAWDCDASSPHAVLLEPIKVAR
jgi:hypothetical protein